MSSKILITAALPYANGPLHFGHIAGAYLPADCYARFQRFKGKDVLFICGSDEYGVAITLSAELAKRTPKEHVDIYHEVNKAFFATLGLSFDHYSRTTWPGHALTTQEFFQDLLKNGYVEEKVTDQLYSEMDRRFLADRYVIGTCPKCGFEEARGDECQRCGSSYEAIDLKKPRSKISGAPLVLKPTKHWFLRFDLFKDKLAKWLHEKDWKSNVVHFARSYVEELHARAITRDSEWGIPVPIAGTQGKVFYVWFDAPIGYISATKDWAETKGKPEAWKSYWLDPATKLVQFIGKDNIPFHAVFFPAMIMGQDVCYKLVDELPANEFYNLEGRQFSKSEGWTIDLESFFQTYTSDQIRYTIAANAPETQDSEFSWRDFQTRCNAELLGKYGNLVNRTLVFAAAHCEKKVPQCGALEPLDQEFFAKVEQIASDVSISYEKFHLRKASQQIMELCQVGNVYFDAKKPWNLAKDPKTLSEMNTTIYCCLECLKALAIISSPIIPETASKLWKLLGYQMPLTEKGWDEILKTRISPGQLLPKSEVLFKRVEDELIEKEIAHLQLLKQKLDAKPSIKHEPLKAEISIEDVRKLDLRVAQVLSAERVPKSKKLLKLSVDLGFEKRQIVAGIGDKIADLDQLIGKKVIIVANLRPAQLMGIESQGMVLAADSLQGLELPDLKTCPLGSSVF